MSVMGMRASWLVAVVAGLLVAGPAVGQREKLKVGDPAPALDIETWSGDEAVTLSPDGVYVVLFWEAASGRGHTDEDTIKAMKRLERLMEQYGRQGLNVIVVVPQEVKLDPKEVHVALDRRSQSQRNWVGAAQIRDLPVAFIVGKGRILHIGKPRDDNFQDIVAQALTGRYDPVLQAKAAPLLAAARRARDVKNFRMATKQYDEVIALDTQVFASVALERFEMLLVDMKDEQAAYEYARKLVDDTFSRDAGALKMLASKITSDPKLDESKRDLDLALLAAQHAADLLGPRDPSGLATVASVHFYRGEYKEAVDQQAQAYFLSLPAQKASYKQVLDQYRSAAQRASMNSGR